MKKGKVCNICETKMEILDTHHIKSRAYDGTNSDYNLTHLCPNCHRKVHLGWIVIDGWFMTTGGRLLFWHKSDEDTITETKEKEVYIIPRSK